MASGVGTARQARGALLSIAAALALSAPAVAATPEAQHLEVAGQQREYLLFTPDAMPAGPRPLVLLLHGHLGTAANAMGTGRSPSPLSAWLAVAAREKLRLAALQGLKGRDGRTGWHDCRRDAGDNPEVDDVAFASAVVRQLVDAGQVDARRIYVMGMSNGAMMTLRLALEMTPRPAAVAAVAGSMARQSDCAAARGPVSVLLIAGTADPLVPYDGGEVGLGSRANRGEVTGVAATRDYWLHTDCLVGAKPVAFAFPHSGTGDTHADRQAWGPDGGPQVAVLTIRNGGHVEPSLRFDYPRLYYRIVGPQSHDLESAEEAWRFFHDKQVATAMPCP